MNEAGVSARRNMGKAGRTIIVEDFEPTSNLGV
jgi:hypothetical protein